MTDQEICNVNASIEAVVSKFQRTPNVFLTEEDLRLHLCSNLLQHFGTEQATQDGDLSISLHSEVRWYGGAGDLTTRSDIVLADVADLKVLHYNKMPSKGYAFNIPKGIIELKFRRPNGKSDSGFLRDIQDDLNKLSGLKQEFYDAQGRYQTAFWMVILDKKAELQDIPAVVGIETIYKFSNHSYPRLSNPN
jgi:hypothetical protein